MDYRLMGIGGIENVIYNSRNFKWTIDANS